MNVVKCRIFFIVSPQHWGIKYRLKGSINCFVIISKNTFYASIRKIDGVGSSSIDCNIQIVQTEQVRDLVYKKEDFKLDYRKNLNFVSNSQDVIEMTESEVKISNDKKLSINVPNRVFSFNNNNRRIISSSTYSHSPWLNSFHRYETEEGRATQGIIYFIHVMLLRI